MLSNLTLNREAPFNDPKIKSLLKYSNSSPMYSIPWEIAIEGVQENTGGWNSMFLQLSILAGHGSLIFSLLL